MTPRPGNSFAVLAKTIHVKNVEALQAEERRRERRAFARTTVNVKPFVARQFIEPRSKPSVGNIYRARQVSLREFGSVAYVKNHLV